jgi:hypothetical protein
MDRLWYAKKNVAGVVLGEYIRLWIRYATQENSREAKKYWTFENKFDILVA